MKGKAPVSTRYDIDARMDDESYKTVTFPVLLPGETPEAYVARTADAATGQPAVPQRADITKILGSRQRTPSGASDAATSASVATTDVASLTTSLLHAAQAGSEAPVSLAQNTVEPGPDAPLRPMTLPQAQVPSDEDFQGDGVFRDYCERCGKYRNLEMLNGRSLCVACYHDDIDTGLREAVTSFAGQKGLCSECGEMHGVKKVLLGARVPRLLCMNCMAQELDRQIALGKRAWDSGHRVGRKDAVTIIVFSVALAILVAILTLTILSGHF